MKKGFVLSTEFPNGTSLQGYINASYKKLVELLGEPNGQTDHYKVSSEWILKSDAGKMVTLYDYKETDMYSKGLPSIETFRNRKSYEWHVGAENTEIAEKFILWLDEQL